MARFIAENRLTDPASIQSFDTGGYRFQPHLSDGDRWAFCARQRDGGYPASSIKGSATGRASAGQKAMITSVIADLRSGFVR